MAADKKILRGIPSVEKVLQLPVLVALREEVGHDSVKLHVAARLDDLRRRLTAGEDKETAQWLGSDGFLHDLGEAVVADVSESHAGSMRPVFNLSGTVIHTNLGRAGLPGVAIAAMHRAAVRPQNLEYDLHSGERGDRDSHIQPLISTLTGAEDATVVNNNAAAVLLIANTLAQDKDVLISRGELVEIGGAFRIPDVMQSAHCRLKEVGTTNRTRLQDYARAIDERTGLLMKVHTSNYEIRGFTGSVPESELATLAAKHDLPFVSDLGSGTLVDLTRFGLPKEPTVKETLAAGAHLVCFSGDKLLGGPQAGIIAGRRDLVARIKRNPMKRALRVDKITLAGLAATLNLYRDPASLPRRLPILMDLTRPAEEIQTLAEQLLPALTEIFKGKAKVAIQPCQSQIGSGALPVEILPSRALVITPITKKGQSEAALQHIVQSLRSTEIPIIGRLHAGSLLLDLRCLHDPDGFVEQLTSLKE